MSSWQVLQVSVPTKSVGSVCRTYFCDGEEDLGLSLGDSGPGAPAWETTTMLTMSNRAAPVKCFRRPISIGPSVPRALSLDELCGSWIFTASARQFEPSGNRGHSFKQAAIIDRMHVSRLSTIAHLQEVRSGSSRVKPGRVCQYAVSELRML